jgi:hypothetical protein
MRDRIRAWAGNPGWGEIAIGSVVTWTIVIILSQLVFGDDGIDAIDFLVWGVATVIATFLAIKLAGVAMRTLRRQSRREG